MGVHRTELQLCYTGGDHEFKPKWQPKTPDTAIGPLTPAGRCVHAHFLLQQRAVPLYLFLRR